MATETKVNHITAKAGADLTAGLYKFGVYDSAGKIVVASAAQGAVAGVIDENVAADVSFPLAVPDGCIKKVMAGAITTVGGLVATDASGRAIDYVEAVNNRALGVFLDAAGAAGDIIRIFFIPVKTGGGT